MRPFLFILLSLVVLGYWIFAGRRPVILLFVSVAFLGCGVWFGFHTRGYDVGPEEASHAADLFNQGNYEEAKAIFEQLAKSGDAQAKVYLGRMYSKGLGVPKDEVEAQKWFILAGQIGLTLAPDQQRDAAERARKWIATR